MNWDTVLSLKGKKKQTPNKQQKSQNFEHIQSRIKCLICFLESSYIMQMEILFFQEKLGKPNQTKPKPKLNPTTGSGHTKIIFFLCFLLPDVMQCM